MPSSMILTYLTIWVSKGKSIFQKMTWLLRHIDKLGIDYLKFGCWLLYNNKQQRFLLGGIVFVVIIIVRRDRNRSILASNIIPTIIIDYQHNKIPKSPFCSRYCSSSIFLCKSGSFIPSNPVWSAWKTANNRAEHHCCGCLLCFTGNECCAYVG